MKKLQASANQWNKALNLADTELRAANEAMAKSGKNILKIRSGSTTLQKAMLLLGKGLGEAGSIFRLATEQLGKVIPKIKTGFGWLGSMGFKLVNIGGILDGLKGSKGLSILTKIFKKVLIVFAIFDIYKGATDETRIQEILGKSKEQATAFELGISGVSNAIGNFFSGFAHLAGTVIGYLGGEHLAKYLEGVDLAPAIAKVFTGILALFKTIGNILGAIFSGGGGDESSFTKLVKVVGSILSWIVDFFVNTAQALEMLTSGDASGAWAMFAKSFEGIFDGIISGITAAIMYIPNMIGSAISDMFMSVVDKIKSLLPSWLGGVDSSSIDEPPVNQSTTGRSARLRKKADGGYINGYAAGGKVSGKGTGRSDSIPAMLSNGEFVVNAKSTAKHRGLLEKVNGYAAGGSVGDAESYQFLQFQGKGAGGFDFEGTMKKFVNHLDAANPAVKQVIRQMEFLRDKSNNLSQEKVLEHDYTKRINAALIELNEEKKEEAKVTSDAAGAVKDLGTAAGEAVEVLKNEWKGTAKSFTGPIKEALANGGSIGEAFKKGAYAMFGKIKEKLLDQIFEPLEKALDEGMNSLFGGSLVGSEGEGTSASPMVTRDVNDAGGAAGGGAIGNAIYDALGGDSEGTEGGMFSGITDAFGDGWDWLKGVWDGIKDWFSDLFGGDDEQKEK